MTAPGTVPITITAEAAERIAELGLQAAVQRMLEHTVQVVPALKRIEVVLEPAYDTWDQPYLTIYAIRSDPDRPDDKTAREWGRWKVETFPPEICQYIALLELHESEHAG